MDDRRFSLSGRGTLGCWAWSLLGLLVLVGCTQERKPDQADVVRVVAAENFYGNLIQQVGGTHVEVTSLLSDPNVDPHEYEADVADAKAIAGAQLVWENGGGYDTWMDKLLAGSNGSQRVLVKAFDLAPVHLDENEHVWYSIQNDLFFVERIADALKQLDPKNAPDFDANAGVLTQALQKIADRMQSLKKKFDGTSVALTETIDLYQTGVMGLKVLTPFEFMKSIAEGTDPPAADSLLTNAQIDSKQVKVLIYNAQTVSTITTKLLDAASAMGIPVVPVTETMKGPSFQGWMNSQLDTLQSALQEATAVKSSK